MQEIRNFVIISHIDHGKSTLADRFLELTGTVEKRKMREQFLDMHPLEREKGITIKLQPVRMMYETQINADRNADSRGLLYEDLTYKIRGALFNVYNQLGPAFKESVYQKALTEEMQKAGLSFEKEKNIDVMYADKKVGVYRPDFIVEGKIIIEIKALPFIGKLEKKQTWYYLKGSQYRLALLVNFGSSKLQVERIVYDSIRYNPRIDPCESAQVEHYVLNLIDTPGHVDFSYEVSRALAAVEGAILLVDATQGVQAQTVANLNLALKEKLIIIPAVNKIDLPLAEVEKTEEEIATLLSVDPGGILKVSGKTGAGVEDLLRAVVEKIPQPRTNTKVLRALIFDSLFDPYQGVIAYVRIADGEVRKGERVRFMASGESAELLEVGVFSPGRTSKEALEAGEIGYLATGIKEPEKVRVGDTVTANNINEVEPLTGYREPEPMVFASLFPENQDEYDLLRESLKKLKLNDAALIFEPEESSALGRGFKAGFLGMLHMEIVSERLRREYGLILTFTNPSVAFLVKARGEKIMVYAAAKMPEPRKLESIEEPWAGVEIITPPRYFGALTALINDCRGTIVDTKTLAGDRLLVRFEAPLREIIVDFYDKLKSVSQGFASLSYEVLGFREADLVRLDILVAGEKVAPLAEMVPREKAYFIGRQRVEKLKELLVKKLFAIAIQAEVEGKIIARETLSALKKDVTGYLYGGDRTRKMKLWKKQKRGKKKLKETGKVKIPPEVYLQMLKK